MVRIGEYSPNFRGNKPIVEGATSVIFGEYEERRKYYNEQRKLEYKQYLAQKASRANCRNETKSKSPLPSPAPNVSFSPSDSSTTYVRKDVSTQTIGREQRDASTNTDRSSSLNPMGNHPSGQWSVQHSAREGLSSLTREKDYDNHRLSNNHDNSDDNHHLHSIGVSRGRALWDKSIGRGLAEKCSLQGDARDGLPSVLKEKVDQNSVGVSCGRDLWEESRESSLPGKLSIHRSAREGSSSILTEKYDHNNRRLHSVGVSCRQDLWEESGDRSLAKNLVSKEQDKKSQNFWRTKESRSQLERSSREEKNIEPLEGINSSTASVLSQLGEVRRQLATKQLEMEEALMKSKLKDEG